MSPPAASLLVAGVAVVGQSRPRVRDRLENGSFTAFDGVDPVGWDVEAGQARPVDVAGEPGLALVPVEGEAVLVQRVGTDAEAPPLVPGVRHVLTLAARAAPDGLWTAGGTSAMAEVVWRNPVGQALETASVGIPGSGTPTRRELVVPEGTSQAEVRIRLTAPGSAGTRPRLLLEDVSFGPASG